ncbi:hypothetical protein OESDEN_23066, partial [Oesophagostomum dentatum]
MFWISVWLSFFMVFFVQFLRSATVLLSRKRASPSRAVLSLREFKQLKALILVSKYHNRHPIIVVT